MAVLRSLFRPTLALALALALRTAAGQEMREAPQLGTFFSAQNLKGTFVVHGLTANDWVVFDAARARERFVPASTFKIPNTLIGLDAGAVKDVDEIVPYGGKPQPFKQWEHDMALREAMKVSAVPIYQELARRIGLKRMHAEVKAFHYGNQKVGEVVDRFWLDGPLKISAVEQVQFLSKLVQRKLPVSETAVAAVEEITLQERTDTQEVHFKTGYNPPVGWVVGWAKSKAGICTFALNIEMHSMDDVAKRWLVARQCLVALGKLD
jgi:beta-lactamase class D